MVGFTLDGREVSAPEGELLVHALARHGVFVPTLCHDDKLDPYGGCRMCVVGVEGSPRPMPACATRVAEGMVVSTNSSVPQFQRTLTEMLLSEHLNANPAGRPNELLALAEDLGVEAPLVLPDAKREPYEDRDLLMGYDPEACILCARCVRYTQEVMQCSALSLEGRGARGARRPDVGHAPGSTPSASSAAAASPSARPVRSTRSSSRARPPATRHGLEKTKTTCTFCGVGCQVDLNVDPRDEADRQGHLRPELRLERRQPLRQGPLRLQLRPPPRPADRAARPRRGRRAARGQLGRGACGPRPRGCAGVIERHGPQAVGVLASARLTNEENYLIQKLARGVIGTNSVHSCEAT